MAERKVILVLGAGRSSSSLIGHLLGQAELENWEIHVGDLNLDAAKSKVGNHPKGVAFALSSHEVHDRNSRIAGADLVISMLHASMHGQLCRADAF